ncbi:MAG: phosphatidylglycerophosphatase A [candidate division WOR-3 bacterium]
MQWTVGSVFGTGHFALAPGTLASVATIPLIWLLSRSSIVYVLVLLSAFFVGVVVAGTMERRWSRDVRYITIDELVGMLVSCVFVPISISSIALGLLVFRVMDMTKPVFIRCIERFSGGWGVMLDDVAAGILTNAILQLTFRLLLPALQVRGAV